MTEAFRRKLIWVWWQLGRDSLLFHTNVDYESSEWDLTLLKVHGFMILREKARFFYFFPECICLPLAQLTVDTLRSDAAGPSTLWAGRHWFCGRRVLFDLLGCSKNPQKPLEKRGSSRFSFPISPPDSGVVTVLPNSSQVQFLPGEQWQWCGSMLSLFLSLIRGPAWSPGCSPSSSVHEPQKCLITECWVWCPVHLLP